MSNIIFYFNAYFLFRSQILIEFRQRKAGEDKMKEKEREIEDQRRKLEEE
jgi:hypothetical protein